MSNLKKLFAGGKGDPNNEYNDVSNFDDSSWWFVSDTFVQQQLDKQQRQEKGETSKPVEHDTQEISMQFLKSLNRFSK